MVLNGGSFGKKLGAFVEFDTCKSHHEWRYQCNCHLFKVERVPDYKQIALSSVVAVIAHDGINDIDRDGGSKTIGKARNIYMVTSIPKDVSMLANDRRVRVAVQLDGGPFLVNAGTGNAVQEERRERCADLMGAALAIAPPLIDRRGCISVALVQWVGKRFLFFSRGILLLMFNINGGNKAFL